MNGRVETYVHSDKSTENKGAAVVRVKCSTDFAARTESFKELCKKIAKYCYGAQSDDWTAVRVMFPDLAQEVLQVQLEIKENIDVTDIVIVNL